MSRQYYRQRCFWCVKDPVSLEYFHLRDHEYAILQMLDGNATLAGIQRSFEKQFAPLVLSSDRLKMFLGRLNSEGLLLADLAGQADLLVKRHLKRRRDRFRHSLMSILAIRFRGLDPEALLRRLYGYCSFLFSVWFLIASVIFIMVSGAVVASRFPQLLSSFSGLHTFLTVQNVLLLAVILASVKLLHELGHGLACTHFGGECHELGLMLLVFTPCLYCNVSDAWLLPDKWKRIAIAFAGIYVELLLAAIASILWVSSEPGMLNTMCLNVMIVCAVNSVLLNGNPLLRYDGYYCLSDLVEIPNLAQESRALLWRLLGRWWLGTSTPEHLAPEAEPRTLLFVYGVASTAYRWMIVTAILWFVFRVLSPHGLGVVAQGIAAVVLGGMALGALFGIVAVTREAKRTGGIKRVRATIVLVGTVIVLGAVLSVPVARRVNALAVLQPQNAHRVFVEAPGTLVDAVRAGQFVRRGEPLVELENASLRREVEKLDGEFRRMVLHLRNLQARRLEDPRASAQIPAATDALADVRTRLEQRRQDARNLIVAAPVSGTVFPPPLVQRDSPESHEMPYWSGTPLDEHNCGSYLTVGTEICLLGNPQDLEVVLVVSEADIKFVRLGQHVRVQFVQLPGRVFKGSVAEISVKNLALDRSPIDVTQPPPTGESQAVEKTYYVRAAMNRGLPGNLLRIRTAGWAKIHVEPQPLGERLYGYLRRTFRFEL